MLNSINGFDAARTNTPYSTSISKNNDMGQKNKDEIRKEVEIYMNKNGDEVLAEAMAAEGITIDKSQDDWITKTIDKINGILSKKYTPGQLKALWTKERESKEEVLDGVLQNYALSLERSSKNGKLTIMGKFLGFGTKQEELNAFKGSLLEGATICSVGEGLLHRTDISIEEFKKLYAEYVEKTTKANREAVAKINQEMREYNANLAKQRAETKFKPIQATSKSKTYEDKDIRREFFENFLKAEQEKGMDITEILNQLAKLGKFDLKA